MVLEPVGVLVPLAAHGAEMGFLDFHPLRAGIRLQCVGVQDRVGPILVRDQLLGIVAMLVFSSAVALFTLVWKTLFGGGRGNLQLCDILDHSDFCMPFRTRSPGSERAWVRPDRPVEGPALRPTVAAPGSFGPTHCPRRRSHRII